MKIRISLNETSTAGSVYSAPSLDAQEQTLPSDDELAIRDKEEADRQAVQLEKEQKEAAKKAAEKAKKTPPVDKAPDDKTAAPKADDSEDDTDEESEDDSDDEDSDDDDLEDEEETDEDDEEDEEETDEEATASSKNDPMPDFVPAVSPRTVPYPDSNPVQESDLILPVPPVEQTTDSLTALNETPEDPNAGNADKIQSAEVPDAKKDDPVDMPDVKKDNASEQNVSTAASIRQRPYPDCWN